MSDHALAVPSQDSKEIQQKPKWFAGNLVPQNFDDAMKMAQALCKSSLVPKDMMGKPEACLVAIGFGMELGIPPLQAIQNIMVVNGRPTIWGDAALGLVFDSGKCELFDEDPADKAMKQGFGRCKVKRVGGLEKETRFSMEEAKKARLATKPGPWQDYPGRMLQMRARSWALRDSFPDVLKGLSIREEAIDIPVQHHIQEPQEVGAEPIPAPVEEAVIVSPEPTPEAVQEAAPAPAAESKKPITPSQRNRILGLLAVHKINLQDWRKYVTETFQVQSSAQIPASRYDDVIVWIDQQIEKAPE